MKILHITPYPANDAIRRSAVASYARSLVASLDGACESMVCDPTGGTGARDETIDGIRVVRTASKGLFGMWQTLGVARAVRPDAIHVQHELFLYGGPLTIAAFPLFVAALSRTAPTVVTLHHVLGHAALDDSFRVAHPTRIPLLIIRWGLAYLYAATALFARCFIVHHEHFASILCNEYYLPRKKVRVVPHGEHAIPIVPASPRELRESFGIPSSARTIFGFFGYIDPRKNIPFLIEEFTRFAQNHPECWLVVAGDKHPRMSGSGSYEELYRRTQENAARCPNILWHGHVDDADVTRFYKLIDCVILPYVGNAGMSSVLSEALGAGKDVLVSDELSRITDEAAGSFSTDVGSLVRCLREYLEKRTSAPRAPRKHFSWERCGQLTAATYAAAISRE